MDFEGNEGDCFENNGDEIYPIPLNKELLKLLCNDESSVDDGYMIEIGGDNYIETSIDEKRPCV
jgi:hypothetical protein